MFKPLTIADRHTLRASAVSDSADTTINVNGGGGNVPPRPDFRAPSRPTTTHTTTTTRTPIHSAPRAGGVVVDTHREINWGGIVKGAALVAGVVLVGVVAFSVVPAALTSLGVIGPGGLLTGAIEAASPVLSTAGGYLMQGLNFLDDFVFTLGGNILNAVGLGGAASSAGAAASAASAATVGAVNTATGAIAAGATVAFGAPMAIKSILATPTTTLVDTAHITAPTGIDNGGVSQTHTTTVTHPTQTHQSTADHPLLNDMPDLPDVVDPNYGHVNDEAAAAMKTAKVAHHAAHHAEHRATQEGGAEFESAEAPEEGRVRTALNHGAKTSQAWADRVGAREKHAISPRDTQFAHQLEQDRAQLDAALAERA